MRNPVKQTLAEGGVALGTFVFEFGASVVARLADSAGAEFVVFDQEHTGWSVETIRALVATARGCALVPLVRVPATDYHLVARPLDAGAEGLMAPMVESPQQARELIAAAKYPPLGRRGVGRLLAEDPEPDLASTLERVNREQLLIAQIETAAGVERAEEIATVDGIDVLWIGHFDLTASLGIPGQFEHDAFHDAVNRVLAAVERHGKAAGLMVRTVDEGRAALERGFRAIAYSGDLWLYEEALRTGLEALRNAR